jgi:hypothetical protein
MNHLHATQQDGAAAIVAAPPAPLSLDDVFSPLELDFFKRAEELYASVFHNWEDLEPEAA